MFLNGYAVLGGFLCALRLLLAVAVVVIGVAAWRLSRRVAGTDQATVPENRFTLLFLSGTVLIGLNVASWPVLYLYLQSSVREWPGVMCIYGVTQIGAGTLRASRFLPTLAAGLQWLKPLVVFSSGAGYVLYLINRRTATAPLFGRVVVAFALTGGLSLADSVVEAAYFVIPRTEVRPASGCCTTGAESVRQAERFTPRIRVSADQRHYLVATFYTVNLALVAGLLAYAVMPVSPPPVYRRWPLDAGGLLSIPIGLLFLIEVAAPAILGLPFHHCPYDLVSAAPESVAAAPLYLLGCFSVGWSCIAHRFGRCDQTRSFLPAFVARLSFVAAFGYAAALLLISMELLLA